MIKKTELVQEHLKSFQSLQQYKTKKKTDTALTLMDINPVRPLKGIFFEGHTYDAHFFVSDLLKKAKENITLIDNSCDENVFTLLSNRKDDVKAKIYTNNLTPQLNVDLFKHNLMHPAIEVKILDSSKDSFLIIDDKEVYHIGASLSDLGKKWFAFSKFDMEALDILTRLGK